MLMEPEPEDGLPFILWSRRVINPEETVEERIIVAPAGRSINAQEKRNNKCKQS